MLDSFYNTDDFFAQSGIDRVEPIKLHRSYSSLLNFFIWNLLLTFPLIVYWIFLLLNEEYYTFILVTILFMIGK